MRARWSRGSPTKPASGASKPGRGEPPVTRWLRVKSPQLIRPRPSPALAEAMRDFLVSKDQVRAFLNTFAAIDLAGVRFPNPFISGVRFSLATGLHVIAAHERRHLWQAWGVRNASAQPVPDRRPSVTRTP